MKRLVLFSLLCAAAAADDGIVTIQYMKDKPEGIYRATGLLRENAVEALRKRLPNARLNTVNDCEVGVNDQKATHLIANYQRVRTVLSQLKDGDVLVLNMHSSTTKAGVTNEHGESLGVEWTGFWKHYGIERPPRLALVVVNGCMGSVEDADKEVEALRELLGAQGIIAPRKTIDTIESQEELADLFDGLEDDEAVFGDGKIFRFTCSRLIARDRASLAELRFRARRLAEAGETTQESRHCDVVKATEDDAGLIPEGMTVAPWHARAKDMVDGWTPIKFNWSPRGTIERVEFVLTIETIPSIPETDTFYCRAGDKDFALFSNFTAYVGKEHILTIDPRKTLTDREQLDALMKQLATGKIRCVLQDDTFLKDAEMRVYYEFREK